jgi:hypothetical protein
MEVAPSVFAGSMISSRETPLPAARLARAVQFAPIYGGTMAEVTWNRSWTSSGDPRMRAPRPLLNWLRRRGWLSVDLDAAIVPEAPLEGPMATGTIFVERRGQFIKWAHFACPKCGESIQVPIGNKPDSWSISVDWLWRPTLHPSIWERASCGAHFFVIQGKIRWCAETRLLRGSLDSRRSREF